MAKAHKKLSAWSLFGKRYDEIAELLQQAANQYKLAKAWNDAAEAYKQLADVCLKMDSKHEAATAYVEGAKVVAKTNPTAASYMLQQAVSLYTDMGRLNMAARQLRELAEVREERGSSARWVLQRCILCGAPMRLRWPMRGIIALGIGNEMLCD